MSKENILAILGVLGTFFGGLITHWVTVRKLKKEEAESQIKLKIETKKVDNEFELAKDQTEEKQIFQFLDFLKQDNARLREEQEKLRLDFEQKLETQTSRIHILEKLYDEEKELRVRIQTKMAIYAKAHLNLHFPQWIKGRRFQMISVNEPYERLLLRPQGKSAEEYEGKTDSEYWGEEIGEEYRVHDIEAKKKGVWIGKETIPVLGNDIGLEFIIIKYSILSNGVFEGVGGMMLPNFGNHDPLDVMSKYNLI